MFDLITELCQLDGPVGQEHAVQDRIAQLWEEAGLAVERSKIGNVYATAGAQTTGPKVVLAAHADELAYLVRAIHADGYLWLANGQAWTRTTSLRNSFMLGQRVKVLGRNAVVPGVIATTTGHLASLALPDLNELSWRDFWVDTGLSPDELQAAGITVGTRVIWDSPTQRFGPNVVSKALDDRALLAVMTALVQQVPQEEMRCRLTLASTVQEEIGVVGASALGARQDYDAAIVLEIGLAGDIPGVAEDMMPLSLGKGPVLVHKDARVHYDQRVTYGLEAAAGDAGLTIQHAVFGSFGSDGSEFMRADIPAGLIAFPARYTHTPFETACLADIEAMVDWLAVFVRRADSLLAESN